MNNSWSTTTNITSNKATLGFTFTTELDLLKPLVNRVNPTKTRLDIADSIIFAQMNFTFFYDKNYQLMSLAVRNYALFGLDKGYNILSALNQKLDQ